MGRKRSRYRKSYGSIQHGTGGRTVKILIRQVVVCLVIVLLAIVVKKMDHAITNRAVDTIQTYMAMDYSTTKLADSVQSVFSQLKKLPDAVETAVTSSRSQMNFMEPSNEEALVMTFGSDASYEGMRYSSESELQVYASSGGTVLSVEGAEGAQRIRISHGGSLETQYAGCTKTYVKPLDKVRKGQLIASITPGEQSCLTFSMWKDQKSVNPSDYIPFQ